MASTSPQDAAIVGVVRDVSYAALTAPAEPIVYVSATQVTRPATDADYHDRRRTAGASDSADPLGAQGD